MSYILEALRKSERERRSGEVPALPAVVAEPPPRSRPWMAWLVAGLLLFNGVGLTYVWMHRKAAAPAVPSSPAPAVAAQAPIAPPAPPKSPAAAADVPPSGIIVHQVAPPVAEPAATPQPRPPQPMAPARRAEAKPLAGVSPPAAKPKSKPSVKADVPSPGLAGRQPAPAVNPTEEKLTAIRPPAPIAAPPFQPEPADEERPARSEARHRSDIPLLREMPREFRERVPEFRINMHAYSKEPGERFAIIDMKKYLAGEQIPGGMVLREIRTDGLVLDMDGTRFRVARP